MSNIKMQSGDRIIKKATLPCKTKTSDGTWAVQTVIRDSANREFEEWAYFWTKKETIAFINTKEPRT